jgi:hypothetical protein
MRLVDCGASNRDIWIAYLFGRSAFHWQDTSQGFVADQGKYIRRHHLVCCTSGDEEDGRIYQRYDIETRDKGFREVHIRDLDFDPDCAIRDVRIVLAKHLTNQIDSY